MIATDTSGLALNTVYGVYDACFTSPLRSLWGETLWSPKYVEQAGFPRPSYAGSRTFTEEFEGMAHG